MSDLALRIVVERPPAGVVFRVQRGKSELLAPTKISASSQSFDFTVRVVLTKGEPPNFLGEFAQAPKGGRFIYVNSGKHAGQPDSPWDRRAKISLMMITPALVKKAIANGSVLEARIDGVSRDGGPACASVPVLGDGWTIR